MIKYRGRSLLVVGLVAAVTAMSVAVVHTRNERAQRAEAAAQQARDFATVDGGRAIMAAHFKTTKVFHPANDFCEREVRQIWLGCYVSPEPPTSAIKAISARFIAAGYKESRRGCNKTGLYCHSIFRLPDGRGVAVAVAAPTRDRTGASDPPVVIGKGSEIWGGIA